MLKKLLISSFIASSLFAQSASEFKKEQVDGFKIYKKSQIDGFERYKTQQMKAYEDYKEKLSRVWEDPKLSTKKSMVTYTKSMKTRTDVDFEKESIIIETIAKSQQDATQELQVALAKAITIDTKTFHNTDPLQNILTKIKKPKNIVDGEVISEPILSTVVFDSKPTKKSVRDYVDKKIIYSEVKIKDSHKVKDYKIYSIEVKLPKDTMIKRSKVYYNEVKKQAALQKLPVALVFAVMHTESNFNPMARSHVPAYGLMQIVPKTAGVDSYLYLYKKKKLVTSNYLYNSKNNITMGSAYLHILYYRYLRKIKNNDSKLYCSIAAYNTGAGNVAWAFTGDKNINKASKIINSMNPNEVYEKLIKDLKYDEAKHYLKRVTKRMAAYHKVYGS